MDKSAGNLDLLVLFFDQERFTMTALNDLFTCAFDCREKLLIFWGPVYLAHLQNYKKLFSRLFSNLFSRVIYGCFHTITNSKYANQITHFKKVKFTAST